MKKALFIIVALASVAIGCTKSEVVKAPGRGREIKFDTYVGKTPMTKAESADLAYVQRELAAGGGFQVYAFLHNAIPYTPDPETGDTTYLNVSSVGTSTAYMDKVVSWQGPELPDTTQGTPGHNGFWDYKGVVYWPDHTTSRKLAFAAYGLNADVTVDGVKLIQWERDETVAGNDKANHPAGQSYTKFTYTVPTTVADQKDLLVAPFLVNQGLSENTEAAPVAINFKHLLSRIGYQVVANQTTDEVEIDIQEIKLIGKFPKSGKVDLKGTGVIEPILDVVDTLYTFFPDSSHFVTTSNEVPTDIYANAGLAPVDSLGTVKPDASNRFLMIMPSQQDTVAVNGVLPEKTLPGAYIEVDYQLTDAEPQKARVSLDGWNFAAGKSYTFIFKVSTYAIEFEVKVENWNEHFTAVPEGGKPNEGNGYFTLTPIVGEN
ncbi:MAG: fimbrillin family protein [Bacteroidales bacterium]|nr:fimbrillin family protein [Bacteroidales bacterium]